MKHKNRFVASLIAIAILTFSCNQPKKTESTVPAVTQSVPATPEQRKPSDKKLLVGEWTRTDAPYQLSILEVLDDGTLKAGYFNPKSINVGKATWKTANDVQTIYIELRDENYPGSNYKLTYIPANDLLAGEYYQAVERVTYDVEFARGQ
jgi:hypothetical protein